MNGINNWNTNQNEAISRMREPRSCQLSCSPQTYYARVIYFNPPRTAIITLPTSDLVPA